jgi:hypothetical protein
MNAMATLATIQSESYRAGDVWRKKLGEIRRLPQTAENMAEDLFIQAMLAEVNKPVLETNARMQALLS